ncbi:MAG: hypothetical protein ACOC45_07495, partial [Alkalispirochaetaceae bacterium]
MKTRTSFFAVLVLLATAVSSQSIEEFYDVVAYDATLKGLVEAIEEQGLEGVDTERVHLLDGLVSEVTVLDPNPETFLAEVVLVTGEWQGLEEIEMYQAFVYLEGPEFAERVPERAPRDPAPGIILPNQRLLVAAQVVDIYYDEQDRGFPIVSGFA